MLFHIDNLPSFCNTHLVIPANYEITLTESGAFMGAASDPLSPLAGLALDSVIL